MATPLPIENTTTVKFNEFVPNEVANGNQPARLAYSLKRRRIGSNNPTDIDINRSTSNIITQIANTYFDEKGKNSADFNNWVESMNQGANYSGSWGRSEITEAIRNIQANLKLKNEPWGAFLAGLTSQRIVGASGNALGYYLTDEIIKNDPFVIPALTTLRDELISLETGPLRFKKSSPMIEREVALHGFLMPDAWKHLYELRTKFAIEQGAHFPLKEVFPELEDTQRRVLVQGAMDSLTQASILPRELPEPTSPEQIRKSVRDLDSVEIGFKEGERYSIRSEGKKISEVKFEDLFHNRVDEGGSYPVLVVEDQKQLLETHEGRTSFLVGALMRALVKPTESKYYSAEDIISLFLESPEKRALANSVIDNISRPIDQIFEKKTSDPAYGRVSKNLASCKKLLAS